MIPLQMKVTLTLGGLQNKLFSTVGSFVSVWVITQTVSSSDLATSCRKLNSVVLWLKERRRQQGSSLLLDKCIKCDGQGTESKRISELRVFG